MLKVQEAAVINKEELDQEWVDLILYAMEVGMSLEEIQNFFKEAKAKAN